MFPHGPQEQSEAASQAVAFGCLYHPPTRPTTVTVKP